MERPVLEGRAFAAEHLLVGAPRIAEPAPPVGDREAAEGEGPPDVVRGVDEGSRHGAVAVGLGHHPPHEPLPPAREPPGPATVHRRVRGERDDRPGRRVHRAHHRHELVPGCVHVDLVARGEAEPEPAPPHDLEEREVPTFGGHEPRVRRGAGLDPVAQQELPRGVHHREDRAEGRLEVAGQAPQARRRTHPHLDRAPPHLGQAEPPVGLDPDEQAGAVGRRLVVHRSSAGGLEERLPQEGRVAGPPVRADQGELGLPAHGAGGGGPLPEAGEEAVRQGLDLPLERAVTGHRAGLPSSAVRTRDVWPRPAPAARSGAGAARPGGRGGTGSARR
ncbi:hypothetical protein HRbin12_01757 [bacterium HR12]|nr:hypothetical protein HRbin12_01757 [bacterium HR12]